MPTYHTVCYKDADAGLVLITVDRCHTCVWQLGQVAVHLVLKACIGYLRFTTGRRHWTGIVNMVKIGVCNML